jgi:signal transduction histidine kinase
MTRPLPPPWDGPIDTGEGFLPATRPLLLSDPALALAVAGEAFRQAQTRFDPKGALRALLRMAHAKNRLGETGDAVDDWLHEEIARRSAHLEDASLQSEILLQQAGYFAVRDRMVEALSALQQGIELTRAEGDDLSLIRFLNNIALAVDGIGEHELALQLYEERRQLLLRQQPLDPRSLHLTDQNEAYARYELAENLRSAGDETAAAALLATARQQLERALSGWLAENNIEGPVTAFETFAKVALAQGDMAAARSWATVVHAAVGDRLVPGSYYWGIFWLAVSAVDLADGGATVRDVEQRLLAILELKEPRFSRGELRGTLLALLSRACQASGDNTGALAWHKQWAAHQLRQHGASLHSRVELLRHRRRALSSEAVEFVAHDLRGPMAAMAQQLRQVPVAGLNDQERTQLLEVTSAAQALVESAEQVLGILRAENLHRSELEAVDLGALVDDVCEKRNTEHQHRAWARRCEFATWVLGDRKLLEQALNALLEQAERRSPGLPSLSVEVQRGDDEVSVDITDGSSTEPSELRALFFESGDNASALGARLVARVAHLHRARLQVDVPPAGGLRVALRFAALQP